MTLSITTTHNQRHHPYLRIQPFIQPQLQRYIPHTSSRLALPPSPTSPLSPLSPYYFNKPIPSPLHGRRISLTLIDPRLLATSAPDVLHQVEAQNVRRHSSSYTHPSSPRSASFNYPNQPQSPLPWTWTCHLCRIPYILGTTRRCLEDGHLFCTGAPSTPTSSISGTVVTVTKEGRRVRVKAGTAKVSRKRKCGNGRACTSMFDYDGWSAWSAWRKSVFVAKQSLKVGEVGERMGENEYDHEHEHEREDAQHSRGRSFDWEKKNCAQDCSYPSECRWGPLEPSPETSPVMVSTAAGSVSGAVVKQDPELREEVKSLVLATVEEETGTEMDID